MLCQQTKFKIREFLGNSVISRGMFFLDLHHRSFDDGFFLGLDTLQIYRLPQRVRRAFGKLIKCHEKSKKKKHRTH